MAVSLCKDIKPRFPALILKADGFMMTSGLAVLNHVIYSGLQKSETCGNQNLT